MELPSQEYQSGLPFPSPGDLPDPRIDPISPTLQAGSLLLSYQGFQAFIVAQLVKNPLQYGRPGFDSCVGKTPWRKEWLPTPVFWPGELHGLHSSWGRKESDTTEQLSLSVSKQISIFGICALCEKLSELRFTLVTLSYVNHLDFLNTICIAMNTI